MLLMFKFIIPHFIVLISFNIYQQVFSEDDLIYLSREEAHKVAPLGEMKLSLLYNRQTNQLRVTVIKVENLMSDSTNTDCNPYVKVSLEPGKSQKQQSEVFRGKKNPQFETDFVFKNVTRDDLKKKSIRFKVCNKVGSAVSLYSKKHVMAEVMLSLNQLGLEFGEEVRLWKDLESVSDAQVNYNNISYISN